MSLSLQLRSLRMVVVATVLALVAVLAVEAPARAAIDGEAERDFICRTNEARTSNGVRALRVSDDLTRVARRHSRKMADEGRLHHNPNLGSDVQSWTAVAENVGVGGSVSSIHAALMDSTGHRKNILNARYTQVGIGVERSGNRLWVTQVFREPKGSVASSAASCGTSATKQRASTTTSVAGDWDGDGRVTPGTFKDGRWVLSNRLTGSTDVVVDYGRRGDVPVVGDWNGNGRDTLGIVRDGTWHLTNGLGGGADHSFAYGRVSQGDVPLVGDWNGDGRDRIGIVRDGAWHLKDTLSGGRSDRAFTYGRVLKGDVPLVGDWPRTGVSVPGVVRDGTWLLRDDLSGGDARWAFDF